MCRECQVRQPGQIVGLLKAAGEITRLRLLALLPEQSVTTSAAAEPTWVVVATTRPETMLGDVAVAMNTGTQPAREAANMIDLDSNPTKLIEIVEIGKQLLMTRGALTTFSLANDVAKYFAIIPRHLELDKEGRAQLKADLSSGKKVKGARLTQGTYLKIR